MELAYFEAARNDNVNDFPFCDIDKGNTSDIFQRVRGPLDNSLLHVAASSGAATITKLMADHFPSLITLKNSQGDTALHVAARAGKLYTAKILVINELKSLNWPFESLLVMTNNGGNTPLHQALLALQAVPNSMNGTASIKDKKELNKREDLEDDIVSLACFLVESADPEVCCCPNKQGKSPLCLALECGNKVVLDHIFQVIREPGEDDDGKAIGNCLMQLIIANQPVLFEVLKSIKKEKPKLLLLRDEKGNTLLHGAAAIGYLEGVRDLLAIKSDIALERNHEGFYAIHFASENGHVHVMKELHKQWPHPTELLNKKGQNILHVAAKEGSEHMVRYISKLQDSEMLINMMDDDGNTPLHLAAKHCKPFVLGSLMLLYRSKRLQIHLRNNKSQTAYDIAVSVIYQSPKNKIDQVESSEARCQGEMQEQQHDHVKNIDGSTEVDYSLKSDFDKLATLSILYFYHHRNLPGGSRSSYSVYLDAITDLLNQRKPPNRQEVNQKTNSFLVVATLVVGIAFAASIQVDSSTGGTLNDGSSNLFHLSRNQTIHIQGLALQSFTSFDTLAMHTALIGAFMLCWSQLIDANLASLLVVYAYAFVACGLFMTSVAFFCSKLLRIHCYLTSTLTLVLVIVIYALIFMSFFTFPFSPLKEASLLLMYFLHFWYRYAVYRLSRGYLPSAAALGKRHFKHINASSSH